MPTPRKLQITSELRELLSKSTIAILTDYRGLTVADISQLRRRLREAGIEYRVVKNTLARFAAEQAGKVGLTKILEGPTAIAFGYADVIEPAKVLIEFVRSSRLPITVRGAILDGRILSAEEVTSLASLPPREVLVGKVMGTLQSPMYGLVNVLSASLRGLVTVLSARVNQLEGN